LPLKNSRKKEKKKDAGKRQKRKRERERETVESGRHNPTVSENGEKWLGVGLVGIRVRPFFGVREVFFSRKMG